MTGFDDRFVKQPQRTGPRSAPSAQWLDPNELSGDRYWQYDAGKVLLGKHEGAEIGIEDDRHLFTVAGSRSGKGVSLIVPNLLRYPGSVLVLDPKGENASLTARHRAEKLGQTVYVIDPFKTADVPDEYRAGFNPFDMIDENDFRFVDECASLADALVVSTGRESSSHWNNSAKLVLRGFAAFVATAPLKEDRTLKQLYEMVAGSGASSAFGGGPSGNANDTGYVSYLKEIAQLEDVGHGLSAEAANLLLATGDNERGSILSTVRQNISFLRSDPMIECLTQSGRKADLEAWKFGGVSIYLCLPASLLHSHGRFFRLFLMQLLRAVERRPEKPEIPALMLLDEMHILGRLEMLETAAGLFAGYGVKLWSFWQDLSQLKSLYQDRWETFIGNSGLVTAFGNTDQTTLSYLSSLLGTTPFTLNNQNLHSPMHTESGNFGRQTSQQIGALLTPNEIAQEFARERERLLVLAAGKKPFALDRILYWRDQ